MPAEDGSEERVRLGNAMIFAATMHAIASEALERREVPHHARCRIGYSHPRCRRCRWLREREDALDEFIDARERLKRTR